MRVSHLTPLEALPRRVGPGSSVAWRVPVGEGIDPTAIGLDEQRTRQAIEMAGFGSLTLAAYKSSTLVGKGNRPQQRVSIGPDDDSLMSGEFQWPDLTIRIDHRDIERRASAGALPQTAYATTIDHTIRRGIHRAAWQKLRADAREELTAYLIATGMTLGWGYLINSLSDYRLYAAGYAGAYLAGVAVPAGYNKKDTGSFQFGLRRWSLFPSVAQPDRVALASLRVATRRLVRPMETRGRK